MTLVVPFGGLVGFGTKFGGGYNVTFDPTQTSPVQSYNYAYETAYKWGVGAYPLDLRGVSAAPKKAPTAVWVVLLSAAYGLSESAAYAAVQAAYAAILTAVEGTYTDLSSHVLSGQVGNLVVQDANGSDTHSAFARLESLPLALQPAVNTHFAQVTMTWTILSNWT